jgi:hypothetical protein
MTFRRRERAELPLSEHPSEARQLGIQERLWRPCRRSAER